MKFPISLFLFCFVLACQPAAQDQKENVSTPMPNKEENKVVLEGATKVIVDDKSQYTDAFLNKLKNAPGIKQVELIEEVMILDGKDTVTFATVPAVDKEFVLSGTDDQLTVTLTGKRTNLTSVEYTLVLDEVDKRKQIIRGQADLSPFFFLGAESDVDDQSQESYFCTEFSAQKDDCYTSIRIGNIEDSADFPLLAKLIKNCNGEIRDIGLDDFPNLRQK